VEIVDAELLEDKAYAAMANAPADWVKTLLGKLDSMRRSKERGFNVTYETRHTSNKFIGRVENIFVNLPKSLEWRPFYTHDLTLLVDICKEVQEVSIQHQLSQKCSIGIRPGM
jgi:hypothetical protein